MKKKKNEIEIERIYSVNINHYCAGTDGLYMWQKVAGSVFRSLKYLMIRIL